MMFSNWIKYNEDLFLESNIRDFCDFMEDYLRVKERAEELGYGILFEVLSENASDDCSHEDELRLMDELSMMEDDLYSEEWDQ